MSGCFDITFWERPSERTTENTFRRPFSLRAGKGKSISLKKAKTLFIFTGYVEILIDF
jgi:hypothetical protein